MQPNDERFNPAFWADMGQLVSPRLGTAPSIVDLGCGIGLFLREMATRYPTATVTGIDIEPWVVEHASEAEFEVAEAFFVVHDLQADPTPVGGGAASLVVASALVHMLDDPLMVLNDVRRMLIPSGTFVLYDWFKRPIAEYMAARSDETNEDTDAARAGRFRLWPAHNKYTVDDWRWLLEQGGFDIRGDERPHPNFHMFVATPQQ
jgi:trans-aconitate methyltransferase